MSVLLLVTNNLLNDEMPNKGNAVEEGLFSSRSEDTVCRGRETWRWELRLHLQSGGREERAGARAQLFLSIIQSRQPWNGAPQLWGASSS